MRLTHNLLQAFVRVADFTGRSICSFAQHVREGRRLRILQHLHSHRQVLKRTYAQCPRICARMIKFGGIIHRNELASAISAHRQLGHRHLCQLRRNNSHRSSYRNFFSHRRCFSSINQLPRVAVLPGFWMRNTQGLTLGISRQYASSSPPLGSVCRAIVYNLVKCKQEQCARDKQRLATNNAATHLSRNYTWRRPNVGLPSKPICNLTNATMMWWANQVRTFSAAASSGGSGTPMRYQQHQTPLNPRLLASRASVLEWLRCRSPCSKPTNTATTATWASSSIVRPSRSPYSEAEAVPPAPPSDISTTDSCSSYTPLCHYSDPNAPSPGAYVDFDLAPQLTLQSRDLTEDLLDSLEGDMERHFATIRNTIADIRRVAALGELPVSVEQRGSTLRIYFPNADSERVERLLRDVEVSRGLIVDAAVSSNLEEYSSMDASSSAASFCSSDDTQSYYIYNTDSLWSSIRGHDYQSDMSTPALTLSGSTPSTTASTASFFV